MKTLLQTGLYHLIEGRHGRFLVNPKDIYVGRSMIAYGEYSEREWQVLGQLVPAGGVVAEIGANIGAFTVPFARKTGARGWVYAVEAQGLVFQLLAANLALNDLVRVQAINAACGREAGWMALVLLDPAKRNNFGGIALDRLANERAPWIRVDRLDTMIDPPRLDLIKIDVEGMEADVIEGARGLIERFRPALYVENDRAEKSPELIRLIEGFGYRLWWHRPAFYNAANFAGRPQNIFDGIVSTNMLGLPEERKSDGIKAQPVQGPEDHPSKWASVGG